MSLSTDTNRCIWYPRISSSTEYSLRSFIERCFLNQHLQWYHNFDSNSARKLVRAICNNVSSIEPLFNTHELIIKRNVSVESYKCKCPLTHDGVFGLSDEYEITNVPCGRAEKEVLCFQHLQYHHNLSSRAAKKIVLALLSYTSPRTHLFLNDDLVTQSKCAVRKVKSRCPLLARHMYGLQDQHQVPNIPCDRTDQHIFLFHHLTYFHKLNAKAATKLIRAIILNKDPSEPLFRSTDVIVVANQQIRRTKKKADNQERSDQWNYPSQVESFSSKYQCFFNPVNPSMFMNAKLDQHSTSVDCKQPPCQISYAYSSNNLHTYSS